MPRVVPKHFCGKLLLLLLVWLVSSAPLRQTSRSSRSFPQKCFGTTLGICSWLVSSAPLHQISRRSRSFPQKCFGTTLGICSWLVSSAPLRQISRSSRRFPQKCSETVQQELLFSDGARNCQFRQPRKFFSLV